MKRIITLYTIIFSLIIVSQNLVAQCLNCGDGSDGPYSAANDTTLAGGIYNFTTFYIAAGKTVYVTGTAPLVIQCRGAVDIEGKLTANGGNGGDGITFSTFGFGGVGVAGGTNGGDGVFLGGPSPGSSGFGPGGGGGGDGWSGGGGAGYSTAGNGSGGVGGFGGSAYGNSQISPVVAGSGGGGGSGGNSCGSGGGGAGGGIIVITACNNIHIGVAGIIESNGGNGGSDGTGNCGGGGGGSGGSILLTGDTINNSGNISALGGIGGASAVPGNPYYGTGANGAEGRIRFDYMAYTGVGTVNPPVGYTAQPAPFALITSYTNVTCNGGSNGTATAVMIGGISPFTYLWSPSSQSTTTAINLSAGTNSVVISDSSSLACATSVTLSEPSAVLVMANQGGAICEGNCAILVATAGNGNGPPFTYLWTPGNLTGPTPTVCPDTTTIYTCVATDVAGCTGTTTTTVTVNPAPSLTLAAQYDTTCITWIGNLLSGTPAGGNFFGTGVSGNNFNSVVAGLGLHSISYAFTDSLGCADTISISVFVDVCTDIEALYGKELVQVFPNPAGNNIYIQTSSPIQQVEMINVAGEVVYSSAVNSNRTEIQTSDLSEGIYLLQIKIEEKIIKRTFAVKR